MKCVVLFSMQNNTPPWPVNFLLFAFPSHRVTEQPRFLHSVHKPLAPFRHNRCRQQDKNPTSSSNLEAMCPPSLVHLTVLLFAIHMLFPSYILLEYQCYFFTHATCLALRVPFGGVVTEHKESKRAATWRGVRVSQYSAGFTALQEMLVVVAPLALQETLVVVTPLALQKMLPVVKSPVLQKMLLRVASRVLQKMLLSITSRVLQKMKMLAVAA